MPLPYEKRSLEAFKNLLQPTKYFEAIALRGDRKEAKNAEQNMVIIGLCYLHP